ncbi:MAG: hypothetical protein IPK88_15530 [Saprospiraceae bacterium]|nr:hypothetical protein [Candidatus Defluviibacterium haderslevense]
MENKTILNQLKLAYCPICNYDFAVLKKDPIIQSIIESSSLYIIAQRPEIRFDNINFNYDKLEMEFEIRQFDNPISLQCKLPLFQNNIATNKNKEVLIYLGSNSEITDSKTLPKSNIHCIKLYEDKYIDDNFLIWFSPDKFLYNFWTRQINAVIEGDINKFTEYRVHYVGQSTKQSVWKRLTGHEKLQDILSLEYPFTFGSLPTHEVIILLFTFEDNIQIKSFGEDSSGQEMMDFFMGKTMPHKETIYLDAEKALINAMNPKYNDKLFQNYPKSSDGLYNYNYKSILYTFVDPITLVYKEGCVKGSRLFPGGDTIVITDNENIELVKQNQ